MNREADSRLEKIPFDVNFMTAVSSQSRAVNKQA